jgi:pyruvate formate-lyase 1-activating enzyme
MKGYIHSIESFGTVDGPGVRMVVFFQGCPMRCLYCHNPDTWKMNVGKQMSIDEILSLYDKNSNFYHNGGGITVTGGEALMQMDFLIALFTAAKAKNIHTCLDTSGITFRKDNSENVNKFEKLIKVVDLIMLDIKHINPVEHKNLTGQNLDPVLAFAQFIDMHNIPLWVRHVIIPTLTDKEEYLFELGYYLGNLKNLKALDVLPYHSMGITKYEELNIDYPLKDIPDMDKQEVVRYKKMILRGIKAKRLELAESN